MADDVAIIMRSIKTHFPELNDADLRAVAERKMAAAHNDAVVHSSIRNHGRLLDAIDKALRHCRSQAQEVGLDGTAIDPVIRLEKQFSVHRTPGATGHKNGWEGFVDELLMAVFQAGVQVGSAGQQSKSNKL